MSITFYIIKMKGRDIMPRPKKYRNITKMPDIHIFSPYSKKNYSTLSLSLDEFECIRLIDKEGYSQDECAKSMHVGRTTVQQIYTTARKKIATALVNGHILLIEGGDVSYNNEIGNGGNKMKIAVTYDNGNVFQHFGHSEAFKMYEIHNGKVIHTEIVKTDGFGHGALATFLANHQVDALICGGIGAGAKNALSNAFIGLYGGVSGDCDAAIENLLNGTLVYNSGISCNHHGHDHNCGDHGCGEHHCHE